MKALVPLNENSKHRNFTFTSTSLRAGNSVFLIGLYPKTNLVIVSHDLESPDTKPRECNIIPLEPRQRERSKGKDPITLAIALSDFSPSELLFQVSTKTKMGEGSYLLRSKEVRG